MIVAELRRAGFCVEYQFNGSFKRRLQKADQVKSAYALIVGLDSAYADQYTLKNMVNGSQINVNRETYIADIKRPDVLSRIGGEPRRGWGRYWRENLWQSSGPKSAPE